MTMTSKEEIYDEIKDLDGTLIAKEYPTKSASVNTIYHLNNCVSVESTGPHNSDMQI